MDKTNVNTKTNSYNIYFDDSFSYLYKIMSDMKICTDKICIITDDNVNNFYGDTLLKYLKNYFNNVYKFVFKAGEKSKSITTIEKIYSFLIKNHFDRKSLLIALGGGVVGDLTGFTASTYMRGIPYIQVPTSLLAQVDSSVGGKTGFDFLSHKNVIGTFYQPKFVYINISTLNTLPKNQLNAGMAEVIKHGLIMDKHYFEYINKYKEQIKNLDYNTLFTLIKGSCKIKSLVVSQDEKELGLREILNFGHTIGHAVESLYAFELLHGECVSIGMIAASYISYKLGLLSFDELNSIKQLLLQFDLPVNIKRLNTEQIYKQLFYDKKVKNGILKLILLNSIGEVYRTNKVNDKLIKEAIKYCIIK